MDEWNTLWGAEELGGSEGPEGFEEPEDFEEEPIQLRNLEVDTVGIVPAGANRRNFVVIKSQGGDAMEEQAINMQELAKAILSDESFFERLEGALAREETEKQNKAAARAKMAMRILRANTVEEAIRALREALKGEAAEEKEKAREEEEKARKKDEEYEYPEEKARKKDEEYEYPEEQYPKPQATKGLEQPPGEPEGYSEELQAVRAQLEETRRLAQEALAALEQARQESRRKELLAQAERYAVLPDVQPEAFSETLHRLEQADPELFAEISKVLDLAATAVGELYGEVGTTRSDGPKSPFLARVEEEARRLAQEKGISFEEAFSEAYVSVGERYPALAWAYVEQASRSA